MGTLRFADLQTRPTEVLDLTSLTVEGPTGGKRRQDHV